MNPAKKRANRETGKLGEKLAEKFLRSKGYEILDKNTVTPFGEIDLIAMDRGVTVFVEVKARISQKFGPPLSSITYQKESHIMRSCVNYLRNKNKFGGCCRIDAIGINLDKRGRSRILQHVKNAISLDDERRFKC